MLRIACVDGNCLDFGPYAPFVKHYFDQFRNLSLAVVNEMSPIGTPSANGFLVRIPFSKGVFTAYTALKCAQSQTSDSLLYEFYVGRYYINQWISVFPCFLETYDAYRFTSAAAYRELQSHGHGRSNGSLDKLIKRLNTESFLKSGSHFWTMACGLGTMGCIMMQYFQSFYSLHAKAIELLDTDLPFCLFQMYFVLDVLKDEYTHYDLHFQNVFLYRPYSGNRYVQLVYHYKDGTDIGFPTEYLVKLIDYGRNYIPASAPIVHTVSRIADCEGFSYVPDKPNPSFDLLIAFHLREYLMRHGFVHQIIYDGKSRPQSTYSSKNKVVSNVSDMAMALKNNLSPFFPQMDNKYRGWTRMGTLHIYEDRRPMYFT